MSFGFGYSYGGRARRRGAIAASPPVFDQPSDLGEPIAFASLDTVVGLPLIPDSYVAAVLDDNPIAYYALDETSGTVAADGVGANDATYTGRWQLNQPNVLTADADPVARMAGGYLTIPSLGHSGDYSVEWLARIEWFLGPDVRLWRSNASHFVRLTDGNLQVNDGAVWASLGAHGIAAQHLVTQFVVTRSGSTQTAYVNGVALPSTATTSKNVLNDTLWLGREFGPGARTMQGRIGRVSLFDRALTPTEVADHYAGGA